MANFFKELIKDNNKYDEKSAAGFITLGFWMLMTLIMFVLCGTGIITCKDLQSIWENGTMIILGFIAACLGISFFQHRRLPLSKDESKK